MNLIISLIKDDNHKQYKAFTYFDFKSLSRLLDKLFNSIQYDIYYSKLLTLI